MLNTIQMQPATEHSRMVDPSFTTTHHLHATEITIHIILSLTPEQLHSHFTSRTYSCSSAKVHLNIMYCNYMMTLGKMRRTEVLVHSADGTAVHDRLPHQHLTHCLSTAPAVCHQLFVPQHRHLMFSRWDFSVAGPELVTRLSSRSDTFF